MKAYLMVILASLVASIFSGWYFRSPNAVTLKKLGRSASEWRKDLLLDRLRAENPEFINNDYFDFNFFAAAIAFLGVALILKWYFVDKEPQERY